METTLWETWSIEAIAACVTAFILLIAAVVAYLQVRTTRQTRNAQTAINLFQDLRKRESVETLRMIYDTTYQDGELRNRATNEILIGEDLKRIGEMLDRIELLGASVAHKALDEAFAMKLFKGHPARCWYQLKDYIKDERQDRGYYAEYVENFAQRSAKYQVRHYPQNKWTKLNDSNIIEEILKELSDNELLILRVKRFMRSIIHKELRENINWASYKSKEEQKSATIESVR